MFEVISKYLDLLKASGWQTGMIALAAGLFLYLSNIGILPPLDPPWLTLVVYAVLFTSGALCAAAIGSAIQDGAKAIWGWVQRRRAKAKAKQAFVNDIPFLNEKERQILGYLREKRQKTFDVDQDGGYASTLLGKRYIYFIGQTGQTWDPRRVPVAVAEHVWEVMQERPNDFPYRPEFSTEGRGPKVEMHPWRIPWMLR
jgi:hypothetical protein